VPRQPFPLEPSPAFFDDLETVDPFYLGQIHRALEQLRFQPLEATRNRKRLKRMVAWCPDATHVLRVGDFRVLFRVAGVVHLLRLGRKAREHLLPVRIEKGEGS